MSAREYAEVSALAALIYGDGDAANRLIADFARDLALLSHRIAGVIQIAHVAQACDCRDTLLEDAETGERVSILQDLDPHSQSCRVDAAAIAHAAHLISSALRKASELPFINLFGKLEIAGRGLLAEIGAAAAAGVPTIVCVPARQWRAFAMGLGEELPCSNEALRRWWSGVQRWPAPQTISLGAAL
jgi:Protein of unknown function (DUF2478)